ncbi:hypothetical protein Desor_4023 [Desulfosporosinus orientis DSM 765]|uniref:Uncharacterized protein n=1 Tax=Desulfosporosinus orientis (strain ATCC 19365 / DSM 765 / NCIMB 8382 / VKM B-1628 / Singapore I) TaxID=768706 RepID=G7WFV0_DESOD|nr:hypothetical protein Desor_4023 [Desulfosporosinus orientis DSM 765]
MAVQILLQVPPMGENRESGLNPERTHHCKKGVPYIGHWLRLGRRTVMMIFEPEDLPVINEISLLAQALADDGKAPGL